MPEERSDQHHEVVPGKLVRGEQASGERAPEERALGELANFLELAAQQRWPVEPEDLAGPKSYRFALGQKPIQLGPVEFRILLFLASRPYHAFTARAIAEAVSSKHDLVTEARVAEHVSSLRDQLGVFYDYVQTVPYIGYRFKE